jgi:hypothetical protein
MEGCALAAEARAKRWDDEACQNGHGEMEGILCVRKYTACRRASVDVAHRLGRGASGERRPHDGGAAVFPERVAERTSKREEREQCESRV